MVYLFIFISLFALSLIGEKLSRTVFFFLCCVLLGFSCFRAQTIGIDTAGGYLSYYNQVLAGSSLYWVERSWVYLNRFSIALGMGYQGVIIISGILYLIPVFYVIYKSCKNKVLGLAVYYGLYMVLYSFNLVRQSIAISFVMLAFFFFTNRRNFLALFWFIIACLFHKSAIVALILVVVRFRISYKAVAYLIITSLVLGILLSDNFFISLTGKYSSNLMLNDGYSGFRDSVVVPFIFSAIVSAYFIIVLMSPQFDQLQNDEWFWASVIGVMMMNLTMRLGQGTRIVLFFSQCQALFIPHFFEQHEVLVNKVVVGISLFAYLLLNFVRILVSQWDSLVPYHFFFNM